MAMPFSILERIELGETDAAGIITANGYKAFSILERIELGETKTQLQNGREKLAFSILERIELGETLTRACKTRAGMVFQYPRTDRIG